MGTYSRICDKVRVLVGRPTHDKLNDPDLFDIVRGRAIYYAQQFGLANCDWFIKETWINTDGVNNEYIISATDFGKPIKVEFYDPNNPNVNGIEVKIINLQDTDLYNQANTITNNASTSITDTSGYIAAAIAFFGLIPRQCRLVPTPTAAVQYRVFYEPIADTAPPKFADKPLVMAQFDDAIAVSAALLALPRCGYSEVIYPQYAQSLSNEQARLDKQFDHYRLQNKHSQVTKKRAYNSGAGRGSTPWYR